TQWIFLKLYHQGKAYQKEGLVNWCPGCKTVLANEQVIHGQCERCDSRIERKNLKQWYFKITDYAEKLISGLDKIDWPQRIKQMQLNWIGKSYGAHIKFPVDGTDKKLEVFTTRPDTVFGAMFMVISPEHPLVKEITADEKKKEVENYIKEAGTKTDVDRMEQTEKTGVFTGRYAVNPATNEQIPIWISDYVLMGYGTGAIMSVPAHDERDWEFAQKFGLEIRQVITGDELPHSLEGKLINSGKFNGLEVKKAKKAITAWLAEKKVGKANIQYKLRDWLISRQRYWGTPIPIIHCKDCGAVPVAEKDLPVLLPLNQQIDKTGRSPLITNKDFLNVKCPKCKATAKRETDTMDTFVDSSWYFLRYPNPDYDKGPFDPSAVKTWLPVDRYIGGAEHAVLHLLYSRFLTKFLYDQGLIGFKEPFSKLINQGMILGSDGNKMSKSRGNVVDPDDYVHKYGSDAVRLYLMFMGPYDEGGSWDPRRFEGTYRFINKIWNLFNFSYQPKEINIIKETEVVKALNKTIKKVTEDLEATKFNTAIASMMELANLLFLTIKTAEISSESLIEIKTKLVLILAPFVPHMTEELWEMLGNTQSVHLKNWPAYDQSLIRDDLVTIIIQVNGKLRGEIVVEAGLSEGKVEKKAIRENKQKNFTVGAAIIKTIVIPDKLVNLVTSSKR
ncbi:MAG: leucine--tRNA ligase, partial [bacterium]|nr:leucine--tRNA ligase [bacterium]